MVIELDKDLYGPDNHLVEWRRIATTQETDLKDGRYRDATDRFSATELELKYSGSFFNDQFGGIGKLLVHLFNNSQYE